jgi:hypothetical protein
MWALPLAVLKLPRLWVRDVEAWLKQRGVRFELGCRDRPLRGCLVAYGGRGCVLLDGSDPQDELRFSLAHEAGHFLIDYIRPRERAVARLSPAILEVFDGLRPPRADERIDAILSDVSIGVHTHFMERSHDGFLGCGRIVDAEGRADRLALELLAPAAEIQKRAARFSSRITSTDIIRSIVETLVGDFGLPPVVAEAYAAFVLRSRGRGASFREWLGVS